MNLLLIQPQWPTLVPIQQQQQQQQLKCKKWGDMPIRIKSSSVSFVPRLRQMSPFFPSHVHPFHDNPTTDAEPQKEKKKNTRGIVFKWADNQSLPVAAAVVTLYYGIYGAAYGLFAHLFIEAFVPKPTGQVAPLLSSFEKGPLCVRNFAIFTGIAFGLRHVMKRLKGKHHACTLLVPGFFAGVILSLVSGMRDPSIIWVGVFCSLFTASANLLGSVIS